MSYPTSEDNKIQKITNVLIKVAEKEDISFSFGGSELYPVEALSDFGGLSLFLTDAQDVFEKLYSKNYTYAELMEPLGKKDVLLTKEQEDDESSFFSNLPSLDFPISFHEKEDGTFFGFIPKFANNDKSFTFLVHLSVFSLEECIKKAKKNNKLKNKKVIPLDNLYDKMVNKISKKKLKVIKAPKPELPNPTNLK